MLPRSDFVEYAEFESFVAPNATTDRVFIKEAHVRHNHEKTIGQPVGRIDKLTQHFIGIQERRSGVVEIFVNG